MKKALHPEIVKHFSKLGKKGGKANTEEQQRARALNGRKGGRPKGSKNKMKK